MESFLFDLVLVLLPIGLSVSLALTAWVLKEIVALKVEISGKNARFEEQMDDNCGRISDHEARIRQLEAA